MNAGLSGRIAVVTGAASGIGRAVCAALLDEGCSVAGLDRDQAGLDRAAQEFAASPLPAPDDGAPAPAAGFVPLCLDLCDETAVQAAFASLAARFGSLDLLVSCAGVSGPVGTPLGDTDLREWRMVLDVNLLAPFLVLKHALPLLREGRQPAVVLLASDSAVVAAPGMAPYCASKAGLVQLGRAAAVEWAGHGIRVNSLCPSVVDTPMSRTDLEKPAGFADAAFPVQSPEQVAQQVLFLLSPRSGPVNGTTVLSDFAYSARSAFPA
ncbi:SDR family NAD(P)-dependent oxidoreductase [Arthrobacter sp. Y-9]|uniref:SDR family NAD(P)-dependent oxidoreductase n=1 Tax=Arthrobacter sp. Y-9 TaxID=3039385 RepID=UPI00241D7BD8|nr:SDR family NAD(P)-dependent oxidoreductase [Arthrobacter sp. Y-9]WFR82688.1 SDR family NAD(P)-dependent oxidoreductase [Arthrobacter sp. Y-9]